MTTLSTFIGFDGVATGGAGECQSISRKFVLTRAEKKVADFRLEVCTVVEVKEAPCPALVAGSSSN